MARVIFLMDIPNFTLYTDTAFFRMDARPVQCGPNLNRIGTGMDVTISSTKEARPE